MLLALNLFTAISCKHIERNRLVAQRMYTRQLIPIDFNDSNYVGLGLYAIDTITQKGWSISYLVKDDSSKYNDIYIKWQRGNIKGIYKGEFLLQYRRYFVPEYSGENSKYLFFKHGCATDCRAILTLSKDSATSKDYIRVVDYNVSNGQIAYVTERGSEDFRPFQISIVDLAKSKEHSVQFKSLCMYAAHKESCIDTIIFRKHKVLIKATLTIDDYYKDKDVVEKKVVNLH